MRLFVYDRTAAGKKIYLNLNASSREELRLTLKSTHFNVNGQSYTINDVQAEPNDHTAPIMALGGVIGVAGGPIGVAAGGILGFLFGKNALESDKRQAQNFNQNVVQNV